VLWKATKIAATSEEITAACVEYGFDSTTHAGRASASAKRKVEVLKDARDSERK